MFENKTVLVTGATGLIGSHIVYELLKQKNVNVIAMGRNEEKLKVVFGKYINNVNFKYIKHDITEPIHIEDTVIDYIFNAAGPMESKIIANSPVDVINCNIKGTVNCIELLKGQQNIYGVKGRLIIFSSVTVYKNNTDRDLCVNESDTAATDPLSSANAPYSQSKRMIEVISNAYAKQYNVDVVIARFSTVYGNTAIIPDTAFYEFINRASKGQDIVLNNSGLARRDNIYIDDAVKGILTVASKGKSGEAYNISSNREKGNYASVDEIAEMIAHVYNKKNAKDSKPINVIFKSKADNSRAVGLYLDNSRLKKLGWELETSLEKGIANTLSFFKSDV